MEAPITRHAIYALATTFKVSADEDGSAPGKCAPDVEEEHFAVRGTDTRP
jgi:hypothetical protein